MPIVPNTAERLALLRANLGPGPILDLFGAVGLKVVTAAERLGVFTALRHSPKSATELAESLALDAESTQASLRLLEPLGYVDERDGRFELTSMSRKWLVDGSFVDFLRWWDEVVLPYWDEQLEDALRTGSPKVGLYERLDEFGWERGQAAMESVAETLMPEAIGKIDLVGDSGLLLDLGGGHGLYSIEICRRNPGWSALVVDHELALVRAKTNIETSGMSEKVSTLPGDFRVDPLPETYHGVLLANVIHGYDVDGALDVLTRVRAGLTPGSPVFVIEQLDTNLVGRVGSFTPAFLGFTYLVGLRGRIYTESELTELLLEAGYQDVRVTKLRRHPGNAIIRAVKPPG